MSLFKMTEKRKIQMDNIISIIENRIESTEMNLEHSERFSKLAKYSEDEKKEYVNDLFLKLDNYKLDYDILLIIRFRNDKFLIDMHSKESRGWYKESDVPKNLLLGTIDNTLNHFKLVESRSHSSVKDWFMDKINLLEDLKSYYEGNETI